MKVVNFYKHKLSDKDVYIGRPGKGKPGKLGNPFKLSFNESRDSVLYKFENWARANKQYLCEIAKLHEDANLVCFCSPKPCHGDIIIKLYKEIKSGKLRIL